MNCKSCRHDLVAYVQRESNPAQRAQIAQHLDRCDSCYRLYRQHLGLSDELRRTVPLIGRGYKPAFESLRSTYARRPQLYPYGLFMLALAVMLIIPLTMGRPGLTLAAAATQPTPHMIVPVTPNSRANQTVTRVAFNLTPEPSARELPALDVINTP